jgi:hypothetical protein
MSVFLLEATMVTFWKADKIAQQMLEQVYFGEMSPRNLSPVLQDECSAALGYYRAALSFRGLSFVAVYLMDAYVVVKYWNLHISLARFAGVEFSKFWQNSAAYIFYTLLISTVVAESLFIYDFWKPDPYNLKSQHSTALYIFTSLPIALLTCCFAYSIWRIKMSTQIGKFTISTMRLALPLISQVLILVANLISCPNLYVKTGSQLEKLLLILRLTIVLFVFINVSIWCFINVAFGCAEKQIIFQKTTRDDPGRISYSQADMFTITD